jgi:pimeloyl-ACP methyl ester carboxylesterase
MSDNPVAGPLRTVAGPGGVSAPFYIIPFDKRGVCVGPQTRDLLCKDAAGATDIFVFSHGWNNDWASATGHYDTFVTEFLRLRSEFWPTPDRDYRPLLAGVFWPSAALVAPDEKGPDIAGDDGRGSGLTPEVLELAGALDPDDAAAMCRKLDRPSLTDEQALEVARLLMPVLDRSADDLGVPRASPEDLVEAWRAAADVKTEGAGQASTTAGGYVDDGDEAVAEPQAAGKMDFLRPRNIVRLATVLIMKDRAGVVGASGVSDLLTSVRAANKDVRIHLIGHSYGCRVLLSALCHPADAQAVTVDSTLLLQPAISCYCFAPSGAIPGMSGPGGYHEAPQRCRGPVVATYSAHDIPLTRFFHFAARRAADLGEAKIAGLPPSRYAALGGYGPQGVAARPVDAVKPPTSYAFGGPGIVGLRGDALIGGHGDVTSRATAWMLLNQVRG